MLKLTSSQKQNRIYISIQRRLLVHGYLDIVDTPLEQKWAQPYRLYVAGHQGVPSSEGEDIIWEVTRWVDALGPVQICYTLERWANENKEIITVFLLRQTGH